MFPPSFSPTYLPSSFLPFFPPSLSFHSCLLRFPDFLCSPFFFPVLSTFFCPFLCAFPSFYFTSFLSSISPFSLILPTLLFSVLSYFSLFFLSFPFQCLFPFPLFFPFLAPVSHLFPARPIDFRAVVANGKLPGRPVGDSSPLPPYPFALGPIGTSAVAGLCPCVCVRVLCSPSSAALRILLVPPPHSLPLPHHFPRRILRSRKRKRTEKYVRLGFGDTRIFHTPRR